MTPLMESDKTPVFHTPDPVVRLPGMDLDLETGSIGDSALLSLRGEIDVYTAPRLRQAIVDLVDGGAAKIVVDMTLVDFVVSSGLGVLVGFFNLVGLK